MPRDHFPQELDTHFKAMDQIMAMIAITQLFPLIFGEEEKLWMFQPNVIEIYDNFLMKIF